MTDPRQVNAYRRGELRQPQGITAAQQAALINAYAGEWHQSEAIRRLSRNRRRVADYFDRLNAQGIALGGK